MTRPTKLNPELIIEICDKIERGVTQKTAALTSGITEHTFHNYINRGKQETEGIYFQFFQSLKKSQANLKATYEQLIFDAAHKDWKAAMTYLERKYPDEYGRQEKTRVEHSGQLTIDLVKQWLNE
jgi:hypothetical protein